MPLRTLWCILVLTQTGSLHGQSAPFSVQLGSLIHGYGLVYSVVGKNVLQATSEETEEAKNAYADFQHRYAERLIAARSPHSRRAWNPDDYFRNGFLANSEFINEMNAYILDDVDTVLKTAERKRRFRELLAQQSLY